MPISIHGDRIFLRNLTTSDATEEYLRWLQDPEVNQFLESRFVRHSLESLREYVVRAAADPDVLLLGIVERSGGRHIGNIKIGPIDRRHLFAEVGIMIGDRTTWGRGYATEAIVLVTRHVFMETDVRRLGAGVYASNVACCKAFEKAGYKREGVQRKQWMHDGNWVDGIRLGLLKEEYLLETGPVLSSNP